MTPKACPFCAAPWVRRDSYWIHGKVIRENKHDQFCILQGSSLLPFAVGRYNLAIPETVWHYEVVDGLPIFNNEGRGSPASMEFVNDCFNYIRESQSCPEKPLPN